MKYFRFILLVLAIMGTGNADEEVTNEKSEDLIEVVMKSGRVVKGNRIQETSSTVLLQIGSSQVELSKINIKTVNGLQLFQPKATSHSYSAQPEEILIPASSYLMGDSENKVNIVHKVYLESYFIDNYEVTNARYRQFILETGHSKPRYFNDPRYNEDNQPVVGVTWEDAQAFCTWAKKRVPTEAEWEKAARGKKSLLFPWGDIFNSNYSNTKASKNNRPLSVGKYYKGRSPYGVHDMSGNVWEWCQDWYEKNYYPRSPVRSPTGPKSGKKRVVRGGGWNSPYVDMTHRRGIDPTKAHPSVGFRCARNP